MRQAAGDAPNRRLSRSGIEGVLLVLIGVAIGIPALGLTRFLASLLYEAKPHDVGTFAGAPVALAVVALSAAYVPARRAAGLDPARTLRAE